MRTLTLSACFISILLLAACGGPTECTLDDPSSCSSSQVCEVVQNREKPMCFNPVLVRGKVYDLSTSDPVSPVSGAAVTALDENGAALGSVAVTDSEGRYAIRVPTTRADEKGTLIGRKMTLRAAARSFQTFPSGIRTALPLDTGVATRGSENLPFVLEGVATDIGLLPLAMDARGQPSITGTVDRDPAQKGILVVAEQIGGSGSGALSTAIVDDTGRFTLFNCPPATYSVRAYSRGVGYAPVEVTVAAGQDATGVRLVRSTTPTATLNGTIQIVAGSGHTSVVLAVKSTFNATLARGEVVPGLRAPDPGAAPNLSSGGFTLAGIPDGEYAVLAGFENDGMVRDPDPGISGTTVQFITVRDGAIVAPPSNFKITGAVEMVGPGAGDGVEDVNTATPTFRWNRYPSTASYTVELINSLGEVIWTRPGVTGTSDPVSVVYDGAVALQPDRLYQWRATAYRNVGQNSIPTSLTEDLRGVFRFAP
jgi:hypothetical protein